MIDAILINPRASGKGLNESTIEPPLGLAYIAAMLEDNGFPCKIIDANSCSYSNEQVLGMIASDAKLIGFYMNSFTFNTVKELTIAIRQKAKDAVILLGGPLASAAPDIVLDEIPCDAVVRGEGEYSVLQILKNLKENRFVFDGEISGLFYRNEKKEIVSRPIQRITDLDKLPFPAYHLLPPLSVYKSRARKKPMAAIITSRGCAYGCTFCSKDIFQQRVTLRSAENVLAEIDFMVKKYGIRQLDILDDNFAQKKDRLIAILRGIIDRKYNLAINLQSGIRSELVDEEVLVLMKKAGVYKLAFGIESADEEVLRINKKKLNLQRVEEIAKTAMKMGLWFMVFLSWALSEKPRRDLKRQWNLPGESTLI